MQQRDKNDKYQVCHSPTHQIIQTSISLFTFLWLTSLFIYTYDIAINTICFCWGLHLKSSTIPSEKPPTDSPWTACRSSHLSSSHGLAPGALTSSGELKSWSHSSDIQTCEKLLKAFLQHTQCICTWNSLVQHAFPLILCAPFQFLPLQYNHIYHNHMRSLDGSLYEQASLCCLMS